MDINARKQEILAQAQLMNQEMQQHQAAIANLQQEGLRLEGEFRALERIGAEQAKAAAEGAKPALARTASPSLSARRPSASRHAPSQHEEKP